MKTRVTFEVLESPRIVQAVDYSSMGIETTLDNNRLTAIAAIVDHDANDSQDSIVGVASSRIVPLLDLIQVGCGVRPRLGRTTAMIIDPPGGKQTTTLTHSSDALIAGTEELPPLSVMRNLTGSRLRQLKFYNDSRQASSVAEQIRNAYQVLEFEQEMNGAYNPPNFRQRWKWTRDAVSHPVLDHQNVVNFLLNVIKADHVDMNDPEHLKFLRIVSAEILGEAWRIIAPAIPKWW